jgi:hypothetical protein
MACRLTLVFLLLTISVTAGAQNSANASANLDPAQSLQVPRLAVGLLSSQSVMFAGAAVALWVQAAKEGSFDFSGAFAPMWGLAGAVSMGISLWSVALLARSVRELRARRLGGIDYARSTSFNRRLRPYHMVTALLYLCGAVAPFIVASDAASAVTTTRLWAFGGSAFVALAGLNLWAFVLNGKELKARKRGQHATSNRHRRLSPTAAGFQW